MFHLKIKYMNSIKVQPSTKAAIVGNNVLPAVVVGGDVPAYGVNQLVNFRKDSKFSPNLYKFLTYGNKHLTNVFQDPKTGYYYIGLRDKNGIFIGAMLMRVFCVGNNAETFSMATSITKTWTEVTDWFWRKYLELGKKIYDLPEWGALVQ